MMKKHQKEWVKAEKSGMPPAYEVKIVRHDKWLDWLHVLNEDPHERTEKQRRNLLAASLISSFIWLGYIDVSSISILGLKIINSKSDGFYLLVTLSYAYFLVSFFISVVNELIEKSINRDRAFIHHQVLKGEGDASISKEKADIYLEILRFSTGMGYSQAHNIDELIRQTEERFDDLKRELHEKQQNGFNHEYWKKITKRILVKQQFVWIKLVWNYVFPLLVGGYSMVHLLRLSGIFCT